MTDQHSQADDARSDFRNYHFDKGDSITLIVGLKKQELLVHANYIARKSAFFKTALKKEWREGQTRTIMLPEDDYETVTDYLRFIYSDKLPTSHIDASFKALKSYFDPFYTVLARLYVFGSKWMDKELMVAVIREIHRLTKSRCSVGDRWCIPGVEAVNIIFDGTTEADSVRRLLLDLYTSRGSIIDLSLQHHPCFMYLLSRELMMMGSSATRPAWYRNRPLVIDDYLA